MLAAFANGSLCSLFSLSMLVSLFLLKLKKGFQEGNIQAHSKYLEALCQFLFQFSLHFLKQWQAIHMYICTLTTLLEVNLQW